MSGGGRPKAPRTDVRASTAAQMSGSKQKAACIPRVVTCDIAGYLPHGNDEVLEKSNRDLKNFRDLFFKGGSRTANKLPQKQKRQRRIQGWNKDDEGAESQYEEFEVTRVNNVGV
eukprot:5076630-Pleurochrysis_carterae.AAC.4